MFSRFRLGEVVVSTAGRDRGKYYLIVGQNGDRYVRIADGNAKRIERPKEKNVKHLKSTGRIDNELAIWLAEGKRVRNEYLKRALKDYEKNEEAY